MRDAFSSYHPLVNLIFFATVLLISMFLLQPVMLMISLCSAIAYSIRLRGLKSFLSSLKFILPMMIFTIIINPLFSHAGVTILAYFPSGNPLTLESILYGIAAAFMLASVVIWFFSFSDVMTSDKFIFIFGKIIPSLSLVLSMVLRFVPRFQAQFKEVYENQCLMNENSRKISSATKSLGIMITWSLENAIDTADSMKSRGYGLPNRTAYSNYKFSRRDLIMTIWLIFCAIVLVLGAIHGELYYRYFPNFYIMDLNFSLMLVYIIYILLCFTPIIINKKEDRAWKN